MDIQKGGDKDSHAPEMDYDKLEAAITEKTKAIIPVDLGGIVCDYDKIFEIVDRNKKLFTPLDDHSNPLADLSSRIQKAMGRVAVVADCAHSLGASRIVEGQKLYCGAIADFSSFSFHAVNLLFIKGENMAETAQNRGRCTLKSIIVSLHFRGNNIALSGMNTSDASAENLPFELKKFISM